MVKKQCVQLFTMRDEYNIEYTYSEMKSFLPQLSKVVNTSLN